MIRALDIQSIDAIDLRDFTIDQLRGLKDFKTMKYKDAIYFGQVFRDTGKLTRKRHGTGAMIYNNGRIYEG